MRHQRFTPLIYRGSATGSIAYLMEASPLVRPAILNSHLWLETTRLPYPGYDHILSK